MQIVTTAILIVAAGAVALYCDYRRNRSQHSGDAAVAPATHKETAAPLTMPTAASASLARAVEPPPALEARPETSALETPAAVQPAGDSVQGLERHSVENVEPALTSAAELTSVRGTTRPRRRHIPPPDTPLPRLDEMNARQALAEWLDLRAARIPRHPAPPVEDATPVAVVEDPVSAVEEPVALAAPAVEVQEPVPVMAGEPAPLASLSEPEPASLSEPEPAPVAETPAVTPEPASADDIRLVLRRVMAKRAAAPAERPVEIPAEPAASIEETVPALAAPLTEPVEPVAAIEEPAPIAAAPAPAPAAAAQKSVSVFLSTRRIESIRRELIEPPAPRALHGDEAREIAEEVVENVIAAGPRFEIIEGARTASNSMDVLLPVGFHERAVLDYAVSTGRPFVGLVVSVGVNDIEGRGARDNDLLQSIGYFIRDLLEGDEFACRSGESEFLIVVPGLEGSTADQRLNHIAEQLWDYQLRGVSTWSILFSWGGATAHHERLPDAIANAEEQMNQTRRGRKTVSLESARNWRKAAV